LAAAGGPARKLGADTQTPWRQSSGIVISLGAPADLRLYKSLDEHVAVQAGWL